MRCPNCGSLDTQVKDSRPTEDSSVIRRRRVCLTCNFRFTTFERVQLRELVVIKRNGRRVPFDRDKLLRSVQIALRKRPVEPERIDQVVSKIVRELESQGESEVCALRRCIAISAKPRISRPCSTNCRARRTRRRRRGSERIGLENFRRSI
jgi:transcriptional regulator NrdR